MNRTDDMNRTDEMNTIRSVFAAFVTTVAIGGISCASFATAVELPEGYVQVDCVESRGDAALDLGFKPTKNTRIEIGYQMLSTGPYSMLLGANDGTKYYVGQNSDGTKNRFTAGNDQADDIIGCGVFDQEWHDLVFNDDNHQVIQDGNVIATLPFKNFPEQGMRQSVGLFAMRQSGGLYSYLLAGRVSYCKVYEQGVQICWFVPCVDSSGEVGLYDVMDRGGSPFHSNKISGTRLYAPFLSEVELPEGYAQVDYVESRGDAALDLGFKPTKNTRIEIGYQMLSTGPYLMLLGAKDGTKYYVGQNSDGTKNRFTAGNNSSDDIIGCGVLDQEWHDLVFNDDDHRVIQDGNVIATLPFDNFPAQGLTESVGLFAMRQSGGLYSYLLAGRVSYCKVYEQGVQICWFVPCVDSSGEVGLYDVMDRGGSPFHLSKISGTRLHAPFLSEGISLRVNDDSTITAAFDPADHAQTLYFSLGDSANERGTVVKMADIPAGVTEASGLVPPPGFGEKAGVLVGFLKAVLPEGYREVDYVASTPDGCESVDTGVIPTADTCVKVQFLMPEIKNQKSSAVLVGCTSTGDANRFYPVAVKSPADGLLRTVLGSKEITFTGYMGSQETIVFNDSLHKVWRNGKMLATFDPATCWVQPGVSMYLFNYRNSGGYDGKRYAAYARIYSCVIEQGGKAVADLVPCVNAQGVAGFYNVVATDNAFLTGMSVVEGKGALDYGESLSFGNRYSNPIFATMPLTVAKFSKDRTQVTVHMTGSFLRRKLFVAWGKKDLGEQIEAWGENCAYCGLVPAGVSAFDVTLPADAAEVCGQNGGIRLFLDEETSDFARPNRGLVIFFCTSEMLTR